MSLSNKSESSMKLKSQNLRNAKRQTNQMAQETRKMEVRLQELKLAMAHEKEERERQGSGGFWRSGQAGNLSNYSAADSKKSTKENRDKSSRGRKVKIAVLKDEPIIPPERSKQPGTFGGIASKKVSPRDKKMKGPRCGQCEVKAAHVNCLECAEDYCAACFASFHLKGALKKHRSVPVGTQGGARQSLTPRKPQNGGDVVLHMSPDNATNGRSSPVGSSKTYEGPSLLDGEYNEYDAHAEFQAALAEWRGDKAAKKQTDKKVTFGTDTSPKAPSEETQMEFGTDTGTDNILQERKVEINFNQSGMTYAEKLLLKQHRRNDTVGGLHSGLPADVRPLVESPRNEYDDRGGRMNFDSLKQVAIGDGDQPYDDRAESRVQITEIDTSKVKSASLRGIPQTSMFHVQEEEDKEEDLPRRTPTPIKSPTPPPTPNAPKGPRRAFATPSPRTRRRMAANLTPEPKHKELPSKTPIMGFNDPTPVTSPRHQPKIIKPKAKVREVKAKEEEKNPVDSEELVKQLLKEQKEIKARERKTPRPNSAIKSRPQSARSQSRAQSRAESARPKSRTWMYGEGFITKGPSQELREISMLAHDTMGNIMKNVGLENMITNTATLTDFFRMGVASPPPEERTMTPSRDRQKKDEKYKVSNKLYSMGPRSWRPDSSLGNKVDDGTVAGFMEDDGVREGVREFYNHSDIPADDGRSASVLSYSLSGGNTGPEPSLNEPKVSRSSQSGAKSRTSMSKSTSRTQPNRSSRAKTPISARPSSRAVVMDGEDLSRYDDVGKQQRDDCDDTDALDQLEWELASQEGRLTADGKISRIGMMEEDLSDEEMELGIGRDDGRGSGLTTPDPDQAFVQQHLRASQLMDDFEEMEAMILDESAVKALK